MACNIKLVVDGLNLQPRCLTYMVRQEIKYKRTVTTLDGTEHAYPEKIRPVLVFTLEPGTAAEDTALYASLKKLIVPVTFTMQGQDATMNMRVVSEIETTFLLKSADGENRYLQGEIILRGI